MMRSKCLIPFVAAQLAFSAFAGSGTITVNADAPGSRISPSLYGIFFEEISHAGDGGLYAELIRNRGFEDANLPPACIRRGNKIIPPRTPHFWEQPRVSDWTMDWNETSDWPGWSVQRPRDGSADVQLVSDEPLTAASPHSLRIAITKLPAGRVVSLINEGYWGMDVKAGEEYRLSFYLRSDGSFTGSIDAGLQSADGRALASKTLAAGKGAGWRKYEATLRADDSDAKARFFLSFGSRGTVWVDFVSLFPVKTFHNRVNGMRPDIARMIADLKPAFLRFPGGCYVEGITVQSRPQWKTSLGRIEDRTPTYSPWGYWSTNGIGYHEFLQFAEDVGADALYVANAGISCAFRSGTFIPDDQLDPLIQDTLDAIEYAIGPPDSKWGSVRAKAGHPRPFPLKYIEIGNEDEGARYGERFARFRRAIKAKYPQMNVVLDSWISGIDRGAIRTAGQFDVLDEHSYRPLYWSFEHFNDFAQYKREGWDLYIGEFATNGGVGHGNLLTALGDAAYMMSMENNGDLVKMGSYAPLLENVNKPDWEVNLIHFDSSRVFGRAAYYVCKLFAENRPDIVLPVQTSYTPEHEEPILGQIGLGTYGTAAEFKDMRVESGGQSVYASEFSRNAAGWRPDESESGHWVVEDGLYRQTQETVSRSYLAAGNWKDAVVSLKARALHGHEGFVVILGAADGRRIQWNLGGFGNRLHAVEANDEIIGEPIHAGITYGRWYEIRAEVHGRSIRCYLDGKLMSDVTLPRIETVLASAGRDNRTQETVIKILNTGRESAKVNVAVNGADVSPESAKLIRVTSTDSGDENSFDEPRKIVPVQSTIAGGENLSLDLPPWSLSVLRLGPK